VTVVSGIVIVKVISDGGITRPKLSLLWLVTKETQRVFWGDGKV
jgi:hypothetical protein